MRLQHVEEKIVQLWYYPQEQENNRSLNQMRVIREWASTNGDNQRLTWETVDLLTVETYTNVLCDKELQLRREEAEWNHENFNLPMGDRDLEVAGKILISATREIDLDKVGQLKKFKTLVIDSIQEYDVEDNHKSRLKRTIV